MFSRYGRNAIKQNQIIFLMLLSAGGMSAQEAHAAYPASEFARVINPQEQKVDRYRTEEIEQLQVVLSRSAALDQDPDMLLRLAELYTEKYKLLFNKENEIWGQKIDAYLAQPLSVQKSLRRPVLDNGVSRQWLSKAITALERIPHLHGGNKRLDEVYYFLGFNYWEIGKKADSVKNFQYIVHSYPSSKFAQEAHRYIADYAFANRDFATAQSNYQQAAKGDNGASRPRVLYGLAWSEFKLRDYARAINTMHDAIVLSKQDSSAAQNGMGLQKDAFDSLALFYSEGGDAKKATDFFSEIVSKNDTVDVLRKLAGNYQHAGRYAEALEINKQLIDIGGNSSEAGEQQRFEIIMDGFHLAQSKVDHIKEVALLKQLTSEFVVNAKSPTPERTEQIRQLVRKTALLAHQEGNKSKNSHAAYARAEDLYRLYLGAFQASIKPEDSAEVHYLLADALSQQNKHQAAAAEYKNILDASLANPGDASLKKYQKDSALGLIYSLDAFFKEKQGSKLSQTEANELIAAIDTYVRIYPTDKDSPKYLARAAGILVTSNRMEEARPRLLTLAETYPSSKEALDAAVTLVKDSDQRKDYEAAAQLANRILQNNQLLAQDKKGTIRAQLQSIASRAKFKEVKQIEDGQNFAVAAQRYEQLAVEAKDNEVRFKAYNNAAVNYAKANDKPNELRVYEKILQLYPDNEQASENVLGIANENFLGGKYEDAAGLFELYYGIFEKNVESLKANSQKNAVDAIRVAALLRNALSESDKANDDYRRIVNAANKGVALARNSAEEFLFDTANKLKDAGNSTEAIRGYQKYLAAFPNGKHAIESTLDMGTLYAQLQEEEKAQNYINSVIVKVKAKKKMATAEELANGAHARLLLLAPLENAFETAPLRLPEAQLKADINAKLAALDRLNKGYIEVVEYGDGLWGVEAFRRMALAYRTFASKLETAPVPTEFSPEDKAKFRAQLHNVAAPVYVKVNETLENALKKGEALTVPGSVMANVYLLAAVNSARPDRYPLIQTTNWQNPGDWIMGSTPADETQLQSFRDNLLKKVDEANAFVAIGNWHLAQGQLEFAKIFYLKALDKNSKFTAAINNLAYLEGKNGKVPEALAGFKLALNNDEFAIQPKKNSCRIYMASGLWRHANLAYRQLEVRNPSDPEVKKGLGLSNLAIGKVSLAEPSANLFADGDDVNSRFAKAILNLAKGDAAKAKEQIHDLANDSEFAALLDKQWTPKEGT